MKKNYSNTIVPYQTVNVPMSCIKERVVFETKFHNVKVEKTDNRSFYEQNPHIAQEQRKIQLERKLDQIHRDNIDWGALYTQKDDFSQKVNEMIRLETQRGVNYRLNYNAITSALDTLGSCHQVLKEASKNASIGVDVGKCNDALTQMWRTYREISKNADGIPSEIRKLFSDGVVKMDNIGFIKGDWDVYKYMRAEGLIPPKQPIQQIVIPEVVINNANNDVQQIEEEDELMMQELRNQLEQIRLQKNNLEQSSIAKDNALAEKDVIILQQQNENTDLTNNLNASEETNINLREQVSGLTEQVSGLTEQVSGLTEQVSGLTEQVSDLSGKLSVSEEKNNDLQEKLEISQAKVAPLEERVVELRHDKKNLEDDKMELREDKKMLVDDKKMLQEEKKLLLVDKKILQDSCFEKDVKITELSQIHCNIPEHTNLLDNDSFEIVNLHVENNLVEISGNVNNAIIN